MKLDKVKILEFLRIYSKTIIKSAYNNCSLYETFCKIIETEETLLTKDDFNSMLTVKIFYSCATILYYTKDTFQKGFNFNDYNIEKIINVNSEINKKCIENFEIRDIIIYIRNALAHFKNNLYEIYLDEGQSNIRIKLLNTKASKGPNIGNNVWFEIELNTGDIISLSNFIMTHANTINITGVDFDGSIVTAFTKRDIIELLRKTINTSYYQYSLFNQITDKDKKDLHKLHTNGNESNDMTEFDIKKQKFLRKEARIDFTDNQKQIIFESIRSKIEFVCKNMGLTIDALNKKYNINKIKQILGSFFNDYFEYEALKVIPMGREKTYNVIISTLFSVCCSDKSFAEKQYYFLQSLSDKGTIYNIFSNFCNIDRQELQMIMNNVCDSQYIVNESLSILYGFIFENYFNENDIMNINGKEYPANIIRNAFIHGRWYYDETNNSWKLFDNKDSLKKADQYSFDREITINANDLYEFVETQCLTNLRINKIVKFNKI